MFLCGRSDLRPQLRAVFLVAAAAADLIEVSAERLCERQIVGCDVSELERD